MKRGTWQVRKKQYNIVYYPLEKVKEKYAKEVRKMVEKLPPKLHQLAYWISLDVNYEVTREFGRMTADIESKEINEQGRLFTR